MYASCLILYFISICFYNFASKLHQARIAHSSLEGNPGELRNALARFEATPESSHYEPSSVLVCSLEYKAAGLNLQHANHIIFVHPFVGAIPRQAANWYVCLGIC
jgi:hypothetical protein